MPHFIFLLLLQIPLGQACQIVCLIDVIAFLYNERDDEKTDITETSAPITTAVTTSLDAEQQGDDLYLCRLQSGEHPSRAGYRIDLPPKFVVENKDELNSARASLCISEGTVDRDTHRVTIGENADLSILKSRRKLQTLQPIVGTRTILAVQLTTSFISNTGNQRQEHPGLSTSEIEGAMFGTGPDAPGHDLVSQYNACSFGALDMRPAVGPGIQNGVATVELRKQVAGDEILGSLQDDILEATEEQIGSLDQFDHIIYCIPDDALMNGAEKWTAFTYFHSRWSFFQRKRCEAMSVTIHELGHYLGFRHSGLGSESYGDESGYLGFTVYKSGGPVKCFNGHKNWVAGWFEDRQYHADPYMTSPILTRLVTFVDYKNPLLDFNDVVLIRVGQYFLQYNRAKGINVDTAMFKDQVSITYARDHESDSEAMGGASVGNSIRLPNYWASGFDLVVEVCQFGSSGRDAGTQTVVSMARQFIFGDTTVTEPFDFAWVSIYLDDGSQGSQCYLVTDEVRAAETETTPQPSLRPTPPPATLSPTVAPTPAPVAIKRPVPATFIARERNVDSAQERTGAGLRKIKKLPAPLKKGSDRLVKEELKKLSEP